MDLHRHHIQLLKTIDNKTIVRTDKRNIEDLEYLRSLNLITAINVDKEDDFYYQPVITEKGKAVLYERLQANKTAKRALWLSRIALLITFLDAFTPLTDLAKNGILTILQSLFL